MLLVVDTAAVIEGVSLLQVVSADEAIWTKLVGFQFNMFVPSA